MGREGTEAPPPGLLVALGQGMVHFQDPHPLDAPDAIGAAIKPRAEDHDLGHATLERRTEEIIDVARPHHHHTPGLGPGPVQERPRHAGPDRQEPRQGIHPPEPPAEKRGGEWVLKEARGGGACGFYGPLEGDHRGGAAHGSWHRAVASSTCPRPGAGDRSLSGYTPCSFLHAGGLCLPNARLHLLPEAGAQRTLEAVRCKPWFG